MPIILIILIINMYLVAFFFLFSLNNQQNHQRHHPHHHFHSSVKGTGMRTGEEDRRSEREEGQRGRTLQGVGRAQYKPHPRRLLAMMMSVTASNTTWMFPVSVAQVM